MMTEELFSSKFDELVELSHSSTKLQKLLSFAEELENQEEWGYLYYVNMELAETAFSIGEIDLFIDTFLWCLDLYDQNEERIEQEQILWYYKWLLEILPHSLRFSLEDIQQYFEDFKNRLMIANYSLRPYFQALYVMNLYLNKIDLAEQNYQLFKKSPRDDLSNCEKCELYGDMIYFLKTKNLQEALTIQNQIMNSTVDCDEAIHKSYSKLLLPLLEVNKKEEALLIQQKAYFVTYNRSKYIPELSEQIIFLTHCDPDRAIEMFYKHVDLCDNLSNLAYKFEFWLAALYIAKKLKLNEQDFIYDLEKLEKIVYDLAKDFDTRNENNEFVNRVNKLLSNLK
ncbi:hypothetical protein CN692_11180 [Bacillus sp. AFS002410]|uniref:hypothetical protein n=1 Tax=Bacillus sp. AFS002410 TaxID=2033481 RepID=UPI000BEF5624|nr:hypothetical protein [Bacillus sp. AFS002410]PEJ57875.1 hypothetical protein CN692_11180 [Bacillus sp. AFS002410]